MFELLANIHRNDFTLMSFLLKYKCKQRGNLPESNLKASRADETESEDKEDIPYNQKYLVATITRRRVY